MEDNDVVLKTSYRWQETCKLELQFRGMHVSDSVSDIASCGLLTQLLDSVLYTSIVSIFGSLLLFSVSLAKLIGANREEYIGARTNYRVDANTLNILL